jgi:hypothetical protein
MQGIVHVTPAIYVREGDRPSICLGDADELAGWLGGKCDILMRSRAEARNRQLLELEGLLARIEAAIDAGGSQLPAKLRWDTIAIIGRLGGVHVWPAPSHDQSNVAYPYLDFAARVSGARTGRM